MRLRKGDHRNTEEANVPDKKSVLKSAREHIKEAGLYLVKKDEIDRISDVATDAFTDYPLHVWLCGGKFNVATVYNIMHSNISALFDHSVTYALDESLEGFAMWIPPGFTGSKTWEFLIHGGLSLMRTSSPTVYKRLMEYEKFAMDLKEKYTDMADWYLVSLTVGRGSQGKGIGSRLMRPMLDFIDSHGELSYLETNSSGNVPFYKNLGYRLAEWDYLPRSDVRHFVMVRSPKNGR